ncbi:MAG TPA: ABC transporter ATP-binding protein [Mycobacteriales bacterium]|nr:ABC transporter ATP-binding protein [Mycobacteriales bacterium]
MSEPVVIEAIDLCKHFDGGVVKAVDGLNLSISRGEMVGVTGPSGCGKSTFLHMVAALTPPTSGKLSVEGQEIDQLRDVVAYRRDRIGLVFQLHNLLPHLTACENVEVAMFGTALSRRQRRVRARQLLADVDLSGQEGRPPTRLSGGERQRVALARALANEPAILLADEPTGSLDIRAVDRTLELLVRLRSERPELTVVLVTHDPRVAQACDRLIHMADGRLADASAAPPAGVGS